MCLPYGEFAYNRGNGFASFISKRNHCTTIASKHPPKFAFPYGTDRDRLITFSSTFHPFIFAPFRLFSPPFSPISYSTICLHWQCKYNVQFIWKILVALAHRKYGFRNWKLYDGKA